MNKLHPETWKVVLGRVALGGLASLFILFVLWLMNPSFAQLSAEEMLLGWATVLLGPFSVPFMYALTFLLFASSEGHSLPVAVVLPCFALGTLLAVGILSPILTNNSPSSARTASRLCTILWFVFGICYLGWDSL